MAIKFENIKVGDSVTVKGVVVRKECGLPVPADVVSVSFGGFAVAHVNLSSIATHTPAPRMFKIGDTVTWGAGVKGEFRASDEKVALIRDVYGCYFPVSFVNLRHADVGDGL